jgi:phage major head subunit gpT-like protein
MHDNNAIMHGTYVYTVDQTCNVVVGFGMVVYDPGEQLDDVIRKQNDVAR